MADEPVSLVCDRCKREGLPLHECPYKAEINDDGTECNCCAACRQDCCDDI